MLREYVAADNYPTRADALNIRKNNYPSVSLRLLRCAAFALAVSESAAWVEFNYGTGDANISGYPDTDVDSFSVGVQLQL